MAGTFFDTSAFIKFYYPEEGSDKVEKEIFSADKIVISEILKLEVASALTRKVRAGEINKEQQSNIWTTLLSDLSVPQIWIFSVSSEQISIATELINILGERHNLRTLDSLQLAAAQMSDSDVFICSDKKLGEAAGSLFTNVKII